MQAAGMEQLFFRELEKIAYNAELSHKGRLEACYQLMGLIFVEATRQERLRFNTLFSRMAYASQKYDLSGSLQYYLHLFRRETSLYLRRSAGQEPAPGLYEIGLKSLLQLVSTLYQAPVPETLHTHVEQPWAISFRPPEVKAYYHSLRAVALADDAQRQQLILKLEERPEEEVRMQYDITGRNELFNPTITLLRDTYDFPVLLNLIKVEVDDNDVLRPGAIVVEPDHLVDVTSVAETFKENDILPILSMLKRFLPFESSKHLLLGNIANFFLDELMQEPEQSFRPLFKRVFGLNPLAYCLLDNRVMLEIMQKAQRHFVNLQKVIREDIPRLDMDTSEVYLEPTFYSEQYGLQGRLDVFFRKDGEASIVELKSGKIFKPNIHGISHNHYIQTLLYDLIIRSTFERQLDPRNYILYSGAEERQLRFAPVVTQHQYEALQARNQMLALDRQLLQIRPDDNLEEELRQFLKHFDIGRYPQARGFVRRDLLGFQQQLSSAGKLEQKYFLAFASFIAREHKIAKTGLDALEQVTGQASLWLNNSAEKEERYALLAGLLLTRDQSREAEPLLQFRLTERSNPLANFRKGDIAVLYPQMDAVQHPLRNQLFKCTVVERSADELTLRLRSRQSNAGLFRKHAYWCLEPDLLDSSFNGMYRNLFTLLQTPTRKRRLLFGQEAPAAPADREVPRPEGVTDEQAVIFGRLVRSQDYFLLWGPPGTGKTSVMLRALVGYLYDNTDEQIMLLAYTNRAVDEICAAIESYDASLHRAYLRIGSRYATAAAYRDRLLSSQVEHIEDRKSLKNLIDRHRIIVGTVSSISGKPELLRLKDFDRVIIDEASQILEPMLVGLLPHFSHFTLIGDHLQLPAVVVQSQELSAVRDPDLRDMGLTDLRNSFFERLYKRALQQGWTNSFAQLSHQGRMHEELMHFPNEHFYKGQLKILPAEVSSRARQLAPLRGQLQGAPLCIALSSWRKLFIPTDADIGSLTAKTNRHEAIWIVRLLGALRDLHGGDLPSVGIITPYRAQIAQIRQTLLDANLEDSDAITIDTVERYQGGARDIILLSLCTNSYAQLRSMISLTEDGIDRKLNVALTRAREQLIVLGNPELLRQSVTYRHLMEHCQHLGHTVMNDNV